MFFLFGGTRPRRKCFARGAFRCPACGGNTTYERCTSASWVHLYWVPLFRVGAESEVVVCRDCRAAMPPEVVEGGFTASGQGGAGDVTRGPAVWTCERCGNVNPRAAVTCLRCGSGA